MQGFFTLLALQCCAPVLLTASQDPSGIVRRETHTVLTHKGEIVNVRGTDGSSNTQLADVTRHAEGYGSVPASEDTVSNEVGEEAEDRGVIGADGERRAFPHAESCAKAFEIAFKVTAECGENFDSNDQIFMTSETHSVEVQILGPAYSPHNHKISAWFRTESGKGAHHKGIKSGQKDAHGVPTGELMVGPIACGQEYACTFTKTVANLTLDCGGELHDFDKPDPDIVFDAATERKFDLLANTTELLLGNQAGSGDHALHGQLAEVSMSCPLWVNTSANATSAVEVSAKPTGKKE